MSSGEYRCKTCGVILKASEYPNHMQSEHRSDIVQSDGRELVPFDGIELVPSDGPEEEDSDLVSSEEDSDSDLVSSEEEDSDRGFIYINDQRYNIKINRKLEGMDNQQWNKYQIDNNNRIGATLGQKEMVRMIQQLNKRTQRK